MTQKLSKREFGEEIKNETKKTKINEYFGRNEELTNDTIPLKD